MNLAPVTLIGNVTADPELTYTQSGQARLSFSVAVNHVWYDQSDNKQEKTSFHNIVAWRYLAEHAARTVEKGIGVIVFGRLEQRSYEDKDGNKRSITELVAEEIGIATKSLETIERRQGGGAQQGQGGNQGSTQRQQQQQQAPQRSRPQGVRSKPALVSSSNENEEDMAEPF
jgi:single-strand DNA-binding protein